MALRFLHFGRFNPAMQELYAHPNLLDLSNFFVSNLRFAHSLAQQKCSIQKITVRQRRLRENFVSILATSTLEQLTFSSSAFGALKIKTSVEASSVAVVSSSSD